MWNKLNCTMMGCQMAFGLSFYGVMAILTRFLLEDLNYSEADAMMIVGAFSSIGPLFAIAGGFIADKFLGAFRSLKIAYGLFATGYFLLIFGAQQKNIPLSLMGIALASYARGLMSPSYPALFKRTFTSQENFENAYPINYSINNIGALLGQYLFPLMIVTISFYGGFALSSVIAALAFALLYLSRKGFVQVSVNKDKSPINFENWLFFILLSAGLISLVFFMFSNMDLGKNIVYWIGAGAIVYYIYLIFKFPKSDSFKMSTVLIMIFLTLAFFVYYGQMMTSMTIVSINTMRGDLFGFIPIAPEASMSLNPLWCIVAGPVLSAIFSKLEDRKIILSTAHKVAIAFILTAIAFFILTWAVQNIGEEVIISPDIFFWIHFFQAFAEVIIGSMVVAFILSVSPKSIASFSVSLFSVAISLSGIIGAVISTQISLEKEQVLTREIAQNLYGDFFQTLTIWAVGLAILAFVLSSFINKILEKSNMAMANKN